MVTHVEKCTLLVRPERGFDRVLIFDNKNRLYYDRETKSAKVNFPKSGFYFFKNCKIVNQLQLQENVPKFELPPPERIRKIKFPKIVFNDKFNSPARINTHDSVIELGTNFKNLSIPSRLFILLNEIGHLYYTTEHYCDLFAYYHFCKLGYNNSQAFFALSKVLTLHDENLKRLKKLFEIIKHNEDEQK